MELVLAVHAAGDLTGAYGLHDGWNTCEEVILELLGFQTLVQPPGYFLKALFKSSLGALGDFVPHQDANLIDLLPFVVQSKQPCDFELSRRTVDPLGDLTPVVKVTEDFPVLVTVVDNEKLATCEACAIGHRD